VVNSTHLSRLIASISACLERVTDTGRFGSTNLDDGPTPRDAADILQPIPVEVNARGVLGEREFPAGPTRGFALVVVIGAIGLLALLFVTYMAAARHRSIEAFSLAERARAEAVANIGVNLAMLDQLSVRPTERDGGRYRSNGSTVLCMLGDARVAIAVTDEGGKVDLNTGHPDLIETLIRRLQGDSKQAALVTQSILQLRETAAAASEAQPVGSSLVLGIRSVYELDQVAGMTRDLFGALIPLVTVYSRSTGIDPRVAPIALLQAVSSNRAASSRAEAQRNLPSFFAADSAGAVVLISSEAMLARGARFSRDAVVEFSLTAPIRFRVREWRDGSLDVLDGTAAARLPPC
jgi:general secretion pathway protein K